MYYSGIFSQNLHQYLSLAFIDHRGFGLTNKATTSSDFELQLLIDGIEAFRQYLGFDKVIIVGPSGQGYMALEYAKHILNMYLMSYCLEWGLIKV